MGNIRHSLFDNKVLELILLPTEACNFICSYCYESEYGSSMPPEIINSILMLVKRRHSDLSLLKIGWFGGEPLLRYNDIINFTTDIKDILGTSFTNKYISHMSTNGYLLDIETAKQLINLNTKVFQITLDGTEDWHNQTRALCDGSGTFKQIWSNLTKLHQSSLEFRVNIRIHLHKRNIESINDLLKNIYLTFQQDDRFKVYFRPLSHLGSPKGNNIEVNDLFLDKKTSSDLIDEFRRPDNLLLDEALKNSDEYICYAARPNCFVIRPDGEIIKCTIGLDDHENHVGNLDEHGNLIIDQDKIRKWLHGAIVNDLQAMRCPRAFIHI